MSIKNFFRRLFGMSVEETRVVSTEQVPTQSIDVNLAFAGFLNNMVSAGKIKRYQKLGAFIDKYYHGEDFQWNYGYEPTPEMRALSKQWIILQYKCEDIQLHNYMVSL